MILFRFLRYVSYQYAKLVSLLRRLIRNGTRRNVTKLSQGASTPRAIEIQRRSLAMLTLGGAASLASAGQLQFERSKPATNGRVVIITAYGAKEGKTQDNLRPIQDAIDDVYQTGGGAVIIPPTGAGFGTTPGIRLRDRVTLMGYGASSELVITTGFAGSDNLVKCEAIADAAIVNLSLNGNRLAVGGGYQYGLYAGGAKRLKIENMWVRDFQGDGVHIYDSDDVQLMMVYSSGNLYHGFEFEQSRDLVCANIHSVANLRNGLLVFQGEVGASGAKRVIIVGGHFHNNGTYGAEAKGPLTSDVQFVGGSAENNADYGLVFYESGSNQATAMRVANNGRHGVYLWNSSNNQLIGLKLERNSQLGHGQFSEILLDSDTHTPSAYNQILGVHVLMDAPIKARFAVEENSAADGPNQIANIFCPVAGTSGKIMIRSSSTQLGSVL